MEWGLHKRAGQGHHFRKDWSPELERRRAGAGGAAGRFPGAVLTPDTQLRGPCVHCPEWRAITGPRALKSRGEAGQATPPPRPKGSPPRRTSTRPGERFPKQDSPQFFRFIKERKSFSI